MTNTVIKEVSRVMHPDNTEKSLKCSNCGMMFTNVSENNAECPSCHHHCKPGECEVVGASNEDY